MQREPAEQRVPCDRPDGRSGPRGTVLAFAAVLAAVAMYSTVSRDLRIEPEEPPARA